MTNKELIEKYPWLRVTNRWTGEFIEDEDWTELDDMPHGWRVAFGEEMCEEINQELLTWPDEAREGFRITQIKEKYGSLRFYTNYGTENLYRIISKYEDKSRRICIKCGKPARWMTRGWISPWCDECARSDYENNTWKHEFNFEDEYVDINNYY